jgi:hypothetical protein
MKKVGLVVTLVTSFILHNAVFAEAPVVDGNDDQNVATTTSGIDGDDDSAPTRPAYANAPMNEGTTTSQGNIEQRMKRLESQIASQNSVNLLQQITSLQDQVAKLQGQLETQQHLVQQLQQQQKAFYGDVDARLQNLSSQTANSTKANAMKDAATATTAPPAKKKKEKSAAYKQSPDVSDGDVKKTPATTKHAATAAANTADNNQSPDPLLNHKKG